MTHHAAIGVHAALACLHAMSAIALLVLLSQATGKVAFVVAWMYSRLTTEDDGTVTVTAAQTDYVDAAPGTLAAVASLVSAVGHGAAIVAIVWFRYADRWVHRNRPWIRWLDYGVTAPLLLVAIAVLCGTRDVAVLLGAALCMVGCIAAGARAEIAAHDAVTPGADDERWWLGVGWAACGLAWLPVTVTFGLTAAVSGAPAFVWVVFVAMAALYASFGVVGSLLRLPPEQREWLFGILSATSKVTLHWLAYAGSTRNGDGTALYVPMGIALGLGGAVVVWAVCSWRHAPRYTVVGS